MSYQVKRAITSLVSGTLFIVVYCVFAFKKYLSGAVAPGDLKFWALTMLIFVGAGIIVIIIIQILFHILYAMGIAVKKRDRDEKEIDRTIKASILEDEMDKLINLKASRIGSILPGAGLIASLAALVLGSLPELALNIVFLSFFVGAIVTNCAQLQYYRKSLPNE